MKQAAEQMSVTPANLRAPLETASSDRPEESGERAVRNDRRAGGGLLIVNADDWGRNRETTDRTLDCIRAGGVSSVSAMVFMEDSERAAAVARERGIDAGLHLNLTTAFGVPGSAARLVEHQQRLSKYLSRHRFGQVVFHPGLASSFEYVVAAQLEEFSRLYGAEPDRIDGHHHAHLCMNVLLCGLLPAGTIVRRNFSFRPGEKSLGNRLYRKVVDRMLARRHRLTDFFFSLEPIDPGRLERIGSLAREYVVELETHPVSPEEYLLLEGGDIFRLTGSARIASFRSCFHPGSTLDSPTGASSRTLQ